jgi:ATP-binding cassette, subfamily B, bacterial MsbA
VASLFSPHLKRLLSYVRAYKARMVLGVFLLAFVALGDGIIALMIGPAFDQVLTPGAVGSQMPLVTIPGTGRVIYLNEFFPPRIHNVWTILALSLLILASAKAVAEYLGTTRIQYVGHAAITDLRNAVYAKLIRQPIGFFQGNPTGRLLSAVVSDVERARIALSENLADLFQRGFTLLVFIGVLLLLNWRMALASGVLLPLVVWPVNKFGRKIRRSAENSQSQLGELSQIVQETVTGNRIVKAFGMEDFEIGKFRESARRLLRENMRWVRAMAATSPLMDLLAMGVVMPLFLLYSRDQIRLHLMTSGRVLAFVYAMLNAYMPLKRIGYVYQQFQAAQGATTQVFAYLDREEEIAGPQGAKTLETFAGEIEFDDVEFAYEDAPVLRNVTFRTRKGEVIALVGTSGAGKTTLVNLLPRFHDVTRGAIRVDGVDVREVSLRSLREQIAIVTQETILFHDTVRNNICYGQANVGEERLIEAAKAALAHEFISELPQGYDTLIGERGQRLSGGQRQRIAIARAILKDSPILILDEATSELDSESERMVQAALGNLMVGRTAFVIAHRLTTIRRADRILVLEDGQIREEGAHADLLARGGIYARLYEMQFADEESLAPAAQKGFAEPSSAT